MKEISAIYCDIDGVLNKKYAIAGTNYDRFGATNENMVRVINALGTDFTIVFITGRWAMGQGRVEKHIDDLLPGINKKVFCKSKDYPGTTAEYKIGIIKELEKKGYKFYFGLDDHSSVIGFMHNHGMFVAQVIAD